MKPAEMLIDRRRQLSIEEQKMKKMLECSGSEPFLLLKKYFLQTPVTGKLHRSLPADLRSYIAQLCVDEESKNANRFVRRRSDVVISHTERNNQSEKQSLTNPFAEVIFSNLTSTLDRNSSLLSVGSQFPSGECKKNAIESLNVKCEYIISDFISATFATADQFHRQRMTTLAFQQIFL